MASYLQDFNITATNKLKYIQIVYIFVPQTATE
jgi:hypothetical protein